MEENSSWDKASLRLLSETEILTGQLNPESVNDALGSSP